MLINKKFLIINIIIIRSYDGNDIFEQSMFHHVLTDVSTKRCFYSFVHNYYFVIYNRRKFDDN
jgi:hypothetical protein